MIFIDTYIGTIRFNTTKFNTHINMIFGGQLKKGGTTNDLLNNLFISYGA